MKSVLTYALNEHLHSLAEYDTFQENLHNRIIKMFIFNKIIKQKSPSILYKSCICFSSNIDTIFSRGKKHLKTPHLILHNLKKIHCNSGPHQTHPGNPDKLLWCNRDHVGAFHLLDMFASAHLIGNVERNTP